MSDTFTVELPWGLPANSPIVVNELELEIVLLQQNIIDDLQNELARAGHADIERTKALYDAMKAERDEIIQARDRARAETDVIRDDRARVMEARQEADNQRAKLADDNAKQADEIKRLSTELRHANQELAGIPKLVENKVSAAMANAKVSLDMAAKVDALETQLAEAERRRADSALKNSELDKANRKLASELREKTECADELKILVEGMLELQSQCEVMAHETDEKYEQILTYCEELHGFLTLVCAENEDLKNNNLYLNLLHSYGEFEPIFDRDGWKAFVFCKPTCLSVEQGQEGAPDLRFGMVIVLNLNKGEGHLAYVDTKGELCIPAAVNRDICIPTEYVDDLAAAITNASIDEITGALNQSIDRARNIVHYARLLDIDWCAAVSAIDVARKLEQYVPEEKLQHITNNIARAQALAPRNRALVNRINKRFGTSFELHNAPMATASKGFKPKKRRK